MASSVNLLIYILTTQTVLAIEVDENRLGPFVIERSAHDSNATSFGGVFPRRRRANTAQNFSSL
jgi:hypothetical protein